MACQLKCTILMPFTRANGGGSFISAALLAKGLLEIGNRVIALFPEEGHAPKVFRDYGVEVIISVFPVVAPVERTLKGVVQFGVRNTKTYFAASRYLSTKKVDFVYCNDDTTIVPWGVAAKKHRIACLWHVRTGRRGISDTVRIRVSDRIICISDYVAARLPEGMLTTVVPNPVDFDRFRPVVAKPARRRSLGLEPNGKLFIQIGRDVCWKRPEWSISALCSALERGVDARLIFIGTFSHERQKELLGNLPERMHERVIFMGWVDVPEIYLAAADVLLHPADSEHFGRIFIEAAACNVPVVATRTGAAPEIVLPGVTGYLVDDFSGFVDVVGDLAAGKERELDWTSADMSKYKVDHISKKINQILLSLKRG